MRVHVDPARRDGGTVGVDRLVGGIGDGDECELVDELKVADPGDGDGEGEVIAVRFVGLPSIPGANLIADINQLVWSKSPGELKEIARLGGTGLVEVME